MIGVAGGTASGKVRPERERERKMNNKIRIMTID